jgi:hypothetical protein
VQSKRSQPLLTEEAQSRLGLHQKKSSLVLLSKLDGRASG